MRSRHDFQINRFIITNLQSKIWNDNVKDAQCVDESFTWSHNVFHLLNDIQISQSFEEFAVEHEHDINIIEKSFAWLTYSRSKSWMNDRNFISFERSWKLKKILRQFNSCADLDENIDQGFVHSHVYRIDANETNKNNKTFDDFQESKCQSKSIDIEKDFVMNVSRFLQLKSNEFIDTQKTWLNDWSWTNMWKVSDKTVMTFEKRTLRNIESKNSKSLSESKKKAIDVSNDETQRIMIERMWLLNHWYIKLNNYLIISDCFWKLCAICRCRTFIILLLRSSMNFFLTDASKTTFLNQSALMRNLFLW